MRKIILIAAVVSHLISFAQQEQNSFSVGLMPGFLIAHRSDLKPIESHMYGVELQWEQAKSRESWTSYYNQPIFGYGISMFDLRRKETGQCYAAHANLRINILRMGRTDFQLRLGAGVGYISKIFNAETNRRNQAIGSHLNAFMQTAFLFDTELYRSSVQYGLGISHFSNAAYKMPNLGYNLPTIFLRYSFRKYKAVEMRDSLPKMHQPKSSLSLMAVYAQKERNFAKPVTFRIKGAQVRFLASRTAVANWRVGLDAMLDKTYMYAEDVAVNLDSISLKDQLELGFAFGHEWNLGKLAFLMEVGAYINRPSDQKRPLYERMGFRYMATKDLSFQGTLKFHRGVADYFEWGLMYSFDL